RDPTCGKSGVDRLEMNVVFRLSFVCTTCKAPADGIDGRDVLLVLRSRGGRCVTVIKMELWADQWAQSIGPYGESTASTWHEDERSVELQLREVWHRVAPSKEDPTHVS